jgi:hypothetical protein
MVYWAFLMANCILQNVDLASWFCRFFSRRESLNQRLFIDRPAALSAVCLSWLGRFRNLGEGGPLCTEQAASDRITESTVLASLLYSQQTTFTEISIFSQHFRSRSLFSLTWIARQSTVRTVAAQLYPPRLALFRKPGGGEGGCAPRLHYPSRRHSRPGENRRKKHFNTALLKLLHVAGVTEWKISAPQVCSHLNGACSVRRTC